MAIYSIGIDLIGPLPQGRGKTKFAIVIVKYFTKWAEAEPLSTISKAKVINFVWTNIIYQFGILYAIVTDNGKHFDNAKFKDF